MVVLMYVELLQYNIPQNLAIKLFKNSRIQPNYYLTFWYIIKITVVGKINLKDWIYCDFHKIFNVESLWC